MSGAPVFKTKAGRLTPYALACGYIETRPLKGFRDASVTLWRECDALHVRAHDHANHERLFWESCVETLGEARRLFDRAEYVAADWKGSALVADDGSVYLPEQVDS